MPRVLKQIAEWGKVVFTFLGIYTIVYSYEMNIILCKHNLGVYSHLKIITPEPGHILDDYPLDDTSFYSLNHSLEIRSVKCSCTVKYHKKIMSN